MTQKYTVNFEIITSASVIVEANSAREALDFIRHGVDHDELVREHVSSHGWRFSEDSVMIWDSEEPEGKPDYVVEE